MALHKAGVKFIQSAVDNGTTGRHGNPFSASSVDSLGKLPEPYRTQVYALRTSKEIVQAIFSYHTPIAIKLKDGSWIVPDVKYSVTTTNHQNVCRVAIDNPGFWNQ